MNPNIFPPEKNGWNIEAGKYSVNWFNGPMTPQNLEDILDSGEDVGGKSVEEEEEEEEEESGDEFVENESDSSDED